TRITGARDDFAPEGYGDVAKADRLDMAGQWMRASALRPYRDAPSCAGPTLQHDLDIVLGRLGDAGLRQVACVDLSQAEFGIPVARVIVPGLEGPWTPEGGDYTPGA